MAKGKKFHKSAGRKYNKHSHNAGKYYDSHASRIPIKKSDEEAPLLEALKELENKED